MVESALHKIAYEGDMAGFQDLVSSEGDALDVNAQGAQKRTPLMRAAGAGHTEMVKALVGKGADINQVDAAGRTALHWAAIAGNEDTCLALLELGIDPNLQTKSGMSGFHSAVDGDKVAAVGVFMDWNKRGLSQVDYSLQNSNGKTALDMAIEKKNKTIVNRMKDGGMEIPSGACVVM